jgi:CitMHS family citrate-Mg2+:H+ or citrate-Ca2+:H+ symporter
MLPLFERLKMDKRILCCVVSLGAGTMNLVPWGGPTIRAASALNVGITELYNPIIIPQLIGLITVLAISWLLGKKEAKRLGYQHLDSTIIINKLTPEEVTLRRPKLFWVNIILTIITIGVLISGTVAPAITFMTGSTLALILNYPDLKEQRARIDAHAKASLLMASILLAAGVFTGILKGTGMIDSMATGLVSIIPESTGNKIPVIYGCHQYATEHVFRPRFILFWFSACSG